MERLGPFHANALCTHQIVQIRSIFMVNEPMIKVNSVFFTVDLQTMYYAMCNQVFEHKYCLYMACCTVATAIQYILYGNYTRKKVIDARVTSYVEGVPLFTVEEIKEFKVQRLKHKDCGHTHALLFDWFIPYQRYTIRFVLLHLEEYFRTSGNTSIETYCLDRMIPVKTFRKWLQWMNENMGLLTEMGVVQNRKENTANIREWLSGIMDHTGAWMLKSLSGINLMLFQNHTMPANYMNYEIGRFRHISIPT
jgi:hypothetical protein